MDFLKKLFNGSAQEGAGDGREARINVPETKSQKNLKVVQEAYEETGVTPQEVDDLEKLNPDLAA